MTFSPSSSPCRLHIDWPALETTWSSSFTSTRDGTHTHTHTHLEHHHINTAVYWPLLSAGSIPWTRQESTNMESLMMKSPRGSLIRTRWFFSYWTKEATRGLFLVLVILFCNWSNHQCDHVFVFLSPSVMLNIVKSCLTFSNISHLEFQIIECSLGIYLLVWIRASVIQSESGGIFCQGHLNFAHWKCF